MDPLYRRNSFYYVTALSTYLALMGRYLLTRSFPVFEVIPLFLPVWLLGAMAASEYDERYAFLRTLPLADGRVARAKLRVVLAAVAASWALMLAVAATRLGDGVAGPQTFVYITLVSACALLVAACYQVAIWRFGFAVMSIAFGVSIALGLVLVIVHLVNLKYVEAWPVLSRLSVIDWLGGSPWISSVAIAALTLLVFSRLVRLGIRVKASSEAHL
jgi:hypothetical protein